MRLVELQHLTTIAAKGSIVLTAGGDVDALTSAPPTLSAPSVTLKVAPNAGVRLACGQLSAEDTEVDVGG